MVICVLVCTLSCIVHQEEAPSQPYILLGPDIFGRRAEIVLRTEGLIKEIKKKKNLQSVLQLSAVLYHTSLKTTASGTIQFSYIEKLTTVYINLVTAAIREIRL